jgi:hypothetical protein
MVLTHHFAFTFSLQIATKYGADERTRTADLISLRVGRHRVHILLLPIQQKPTDNMVESISLIVEGTVFDRRHSRHHRLENLRKRPS